MRRSALVCTLALLASAPACFNPDDPPGGAGTADSTGADTSASDTAPTTNPSDTTPTTDPSDTTPTTDPSDTTPTTDPSDTDPTADSSSTDTDPTDTDTAPPACDDGAVDPGELCVGGAPTVFDVGAGSFDVAVADIDGLGLDIITLNRGSSTISILRNDGVGGFGNPESRTVGDGSCRIRAVDGDGDDDVDLVVSGDPIVTLNNDGTGDFNRVDAPFGAGVFGGCGDYNDLDVLNNGGGPIDIVYSGEYNNSFVAGISNGSGWTFADNATAVNQAGEGSAGVTVTELGSDADSNPDVVQLNRYYEEGTVWRGNGSGGFIAAGTFDACGSVEPPDVYLGARWATAGDLNGDGQTDIVSTCILGSGDPASGFSIVFGAADGTFSAASVVALGGAYRIVLPDIDADGDLDLLAVSTALGGVAVYVNDGTGTFAEPIALTVDGPAYNVAVDDLDGDGALDVVVPYDTPGGGRVAVFFASP